jgi:salicylate hydroxylase
MRLEGTLKMRHEQAAIGLGDQLAAVANVLPGFVTRDMHTGEQLEYYDRGVARERYGAPHYMFHRADLMQLLASGLDPDLLHLDHRLVAIEERATGALLTFASGLTREAEIVISADGIHSVVRRKLYGEDNPIYTGQMVWRALLKGSEASCSSSRVACSGLAPAAFLSLLPARRRRRCSRRSS